MPATVRAMRYLSLERTKRAVGSTPYTAHQLLLQPYTSLAKTISGKRY